MSTQSGGFLQDLLARCRTGDHEAIAELVRRFQPGAVSLASALLDGDHDLAEDAVQEAFLVALEKLDDLRNTAAFPGWWRQIVRTQAHRIQRKRCEKRLPDDVDPPSSDPSPRQQAQRRELERTVREALAALPPRQRQTAELFYLKEMSHAEISNHLGIPTGTVKSRLYASRHRLRAMLLGHVAGKPRVSRKPIRGRLLPVSHERKDP